MNRQRAQQIAESPVMAEVTYQGVPVYIQHVDAEQEMARVYPLENPEKEMEVPLHQLMERDEAAFREIGAPLQCGIAPANADDVDRK